MNVTIVDDDVLENVESFNVTLERTPFVSLNNRITFNPVDGVIEITDNDGMFLNRHAYDVISTFHSGCGGFGDNIVSGL